jgi:acyl-CoA synthetase (AMP-forming)/AMP-acid ligase II
MIFHSPYPDVTIPEIAFTPFVFEKAAQLGDKPALIDGPTGRTLTYKQVWGAVQMAAAGLASRGFKKGEVFAIILPNLPEFAIAFHAVSLLGGIVTTINPLYTAEEVTFQLNDTGAKYLLTIPMFMDKAAEAVKGTEVGDIFVLGEAPGAIPFTNLMQPGNTVPEVQIDPHKDLIVLPYSSGTSGKPKGVMLNHYNLVAQLRQLEGVGITTINDVSVAVLPFFHIYGMVGILNIALRVGATLVTMPRFDLEQFLQICQDHKVTQVGVVPPIVLALAKHPIVGKYDLSSLNWILSGAAPLDKDLQLAAAERLHCMVLQGFGMTETSVGATIVPATPEGFRAGSAGVLNPNVLCKIVDIATGAELEANQQGEIWVSGPNIMQGYLNQPEATASTLDADGWLHTGDIGYVDNEGYLFIVDRIKELIKFKGLQVAPAELEAVLLSHPMVADAAVIARPDEEAGEVPKAFVVLKGEISPEELMAYVAERVAPHKKVRHLEVINEIPKSASGKILRRMLVVQERAKIEAGNK